jgi:hypothetical protein
MESYFKTTKERNNEHYGTYRTSKMRLMMIGKRFLDDLADTRAQFSTNAMVGTVDDHNRTCCGRCL